MMTQDLNKVEELYPCAECGKPRTKDEGGTTFTLCDECWEKHYGKQPTEAQKKEFWEWCGVPIYVRLIDGKWVNVLPIDLNNLFKYAWDKAVGRLADIDLSTDYEAQCKLLMFWAERGLNARGLFWAIREVIHNDN